jgi:hypothetical protein
LLSFSQAQVSAGKWSFITGIGLVHFLVLTLAWVLVLRAQSSAKLNPFSLRTWRLRVGLA